MRTLILTACIILALASNALSQDVLDVEKYRDAELFAVKKGYDVNQRLAEIASVEGKEVTVYHVTGKQNKIKMCYSGIAEIVNHPNFSDKNKATLIAVRKKNTGGMDGIYFPLTNDSRYRIYLTEKMRSN